MILKTFPIGLLLFCQQPLQLNQRAPRKVLPFTAPFNNMRTLRVKAQPTNAFFCYRQSNVRRLFPVSGYSRAPGNEVVEHISENETVVGTSRKLQSWTKVLGQIYISGAFSDAPNKQSRANSSTLGQLLPLSPPPIQCWTCAHVIPPEFQHCIGGGGGIKQRNLKRITVLF